MRILVISDTHTSESKTNIPDIFAAEIKKSNLCLHAGDINEYSAYKNLSKAIKTYAVAGNMDDQTIATKLPKKIVLEINGFKFGLIHGFGTPAGLKQYIKYQFQDQFKSIDILIFGHSHQPLNKEENGKIYFNPGSASDTILKQERTYGIIEIKNNKLIRSIKKIG